MPAPGRAYSGVSVVIPTYNRRAALERNFPAVLALEAVDEIVVVVDASTDGTREYLGGLKDDRIKVLVHERQRGSQAARNTGIRAARGAWVLLLDDDCWVPPDFAVVLLEDATAYDADLVSAPWVHVGASESREQALERLKACSVERLTLRSTQSTFPSQPLATPFLVGLVLIRRAIFEDLEYDEGYRVNGWREETAVFVAAARRGHRCLLTPRTASFQLGQWSGGQRTKPWTYEWWVWRNNWRFLRIHGRWLAEHGYLTSEDLSVEQLRFVAARVWALLRGAVRARLVRSVS